MWCHSTNYRNGPAKQSYILFLSLYSLKSRKVRLVCFHNRNECLQLWYNIHYSSEITLLFIIPSLCSGWMINSTRRLNVDVLHSIRHRSRAFQPVQYTHFKWIKLLCHSRRNRSVIDGYRHNITFNSLLSNFDLAESRSLLRTSKSLWQKTKTKYCILNIL